LLCAADIVAIHRCDRVAPFQQQSDRGELLEVLLREWEEEFLADIIPHWKVGVGETR
jgi:hypothetical protein